MSTRKPTIADVASAAGVSKGLVSFALNDRPGVAAGTRDRILAVADDLGWRPSVTARSLSTRTSFALGLVIRRAAEVIGADPFFPSFIAGVESVLSDEGRALVLSVVPDEAAELTAYRTLAADNRVDGVFLTDLRHDDKRFGLLEELGLPAVALGHPASTVLFPFVELDDTSGIRAAVSHLVSLGHRRIAHVAGDQSMIHGGRRRESFSAAMSQAGLDDSQVIETDFSVGQGADATRRLLNADDPPTAIVYANDPMAIAGLGVAQQRGLDVPGDLSITGFDGSDISAFVFPALTTITSDPVEWGRVAARTLLDQVATGAASNVTLAPATLLVRRSTAPPQ
ncbi:LacI family DNA-binding transcriptional regulator [Mycetocola zhujimingii]|uniref:LacI family DNA-binding transcriptional regulator n=1 Tax=Mycetocola zhujimingii TaxID=2079792 RepID=UPI000D35CBFB|nr:LacI family DNA-binding transcriptional regulator [Mycetocola zhujimingii]AWB87427.1 LacI family transcriptional regulator [Mycetocola zhujimingii]